MTGVTDVPLAPAVPVAVPLADAAPGGPQGPPGPAGPTGPTGPPGPDAQLIADAKGDLLAAPGPDVLTRVPVGADGQVLTADAATSNGVKWAAAGGSTDLVYNGDFPANTPYTDGDIVIQNGVAYLCVRPTAAAPTPWPGGGSNPLTGIPLPVVNGQWVKGVGGVPVWSAITPADVGLPKITTSAMSGGPPASPADGDIWIATGVDGATGTRWAFQYAAGSASAYKWEFIGGAAITTTVDAATNVAVTAYGDLPGGIMTATRAGDYDLTLGARAALIVAGIAVYVGLKSTVRAAADGEAAVSYVPAGGSSSVQLAVRRRWTAVAAGEQIYSAGRVSSGNADITQRVLSMTPVRIA